MEYNPFIVLFVFEMLVCIIYLYLVRCMMNRWNDGDFFHVAVAVAV